VTSALRTPPVPSVFTRIAEGALQGRWKSQTRARTHTHAKMYSSSQRIRENSSSLSPNPGGALEIDCSC
jgi:hypothetical protein